MLSLSSYRDGVRFGLALSAMLLAGCLAQDAKAFDLTDDLSIIGYGDVRAVIAPDAQSWLNGGLGKFRYGGKQKFGTEGVAQADLKLADGLNAVGLFRAEPETRSVVDALEMYLRYAPASNGSVSWSVKAGAFFPTISLENDDVGWTSPYTITPSAINSWIGEELRIIGSEGTLRWNTHSIGTFSMIGALYCCNDENGVLVADRGWAMDDNPTGLFERVREPDATRRLFHAPPGNTGEFNEIDGRVGWYAGAEWQIPEIAKLTITRYDNRADPAAVSTRDQAWATKFWAFGARTQVGPVMLIAQQLSGYTELDFGFGEDSIKFQSGFLLASYDLDDLRFSLREDLFQTRRVGAANNNFNEDGDATTGAISWTGLDGIRLTTEIIRMHSRRGQYVPAGLGPSRDDTQVQFDARFFF
ncbi:MAG TPA: hypothetical protein VMO78_11820 [Rhizomicrobium sp.]|nr:hypothetical protein [Rhizomicrobium sp.]